MLEETRLGVIKAVDEAGYLVDARPLLEALKAMKRGDFSVRLPEDGEGISLLVAQQFNDVLATITSSRDILEGKAEQLAQASRYKSEFMANMSHELRTPLNSLLILSQLLAENEEGNLTEEQVGFAQTVYDSGSDLLLLINDILDLSKIESGTMHLDLTDIVLTDFKDDLEKAFAPIADEKPEVHFAVEMSEHLLPAVYSDVKRVTQILTNLLSNAFKFTEAGSVKLRIAPAFDGWMRDSGPLDNAKQVVAFTVSDTGIGIAPEKQSLIFEAFQQADGTTSRKYGGTGLGLAISRELAYILGGQIKLESEPGQGSTFTLYLPDTYVKRHPDAIRDHMLENAAVVREKVQPTKKLTLYSEETTLVMSTVPSERPAKPQGDVKVQLPNRKILVIDDDPRNILAIKSILARQKMQVLDAENGKDGIDILMQNPDIDCVLMDIMMPHMDGYQAMQEIRKIDKFKRLPIIALTARAMKGDRERCLEAGASDYISKPVQAENLLSLLGTWLADPALK